MKFKTVKKFANNVLELGFMFWLMSIAWSWDNWWRILPAVVVIAWVGWVISTVFTYVVERYHRAPCGWYLLDIAHPDFNALDPDSKPRKRCASKWHPKTGHKWRPLQLD